MDQRNLALGALLAAGAACALVCAAWPAPDALGGDAATSDGSAPEDPARTPADVALDLDFVFADAWRREGLEPSARCGDATFVRRVYLDVVGTIPSVGQVEAFVRDTREDKRARLVDELLATPGFARHMTNVWSEVLVGQGTGDNNREYVPALFRRWLEEQFTANRPWPEIVRALVTAEGTVYDSPPVNFIGRRDFSATDMAGAVSKAFLGVQIQCAQCHDHPYEALTQQDFNGFAAFWAYAYGTPKEIDYSVLGDRAVQRADESYRKDVEAFVAQGKSEEEARRLADRKRPRTRDWRDFEKSPLARNRRAAERVQRRNEQRLGEIAKAEPRFLGGAPYTDVRDRTRREALADWIVSPRNPYTAQALANRMWGLFLGRGIVHPVDDFNSVNVPCAPEALRLLADDTATHGFDLKRLVRVITATRAYQLDSASQARNAHAEEFFAVGPLKELTPQQTFDSLQLALGVKRDGTQLSGLEGDAPAAIDMTGGGPGMMAAAGGELTRSERLLQLAARSFFQTFDDDEGGGSEAFGGTVPQGLFLLNGDVVNNLLVQPRISVVPGLVDRLPNERERIEDLYLRTLSREPTAAELARLTRFVKTADAPETAEPEPARGKRKGAARRTDEQRRHAAYADVLWALLASSEFATNH